VHEFYGEALTLTLALFLLVVIIADYAYYAVYAYWWWSQKGFWIRQTDLRFGFQRIVKHYWILAIFQRFLHGIKKVLRVVGLGFPKWIVMVDNIGKQQQAIIVSIIIITTMAKSNTGTTSFCCCRPFSFCVRANLYFVFEQSR
jgi:hypothetical protein